MTADAMPSNTLSRPSFAHRLFLLAAVGARRRSEAEDARHLLRVCLENRRLLRQNQPATAPEKRRELNKGESLRVITPSVSGRILVS